MRGAFKKIIILLKEYKNMGLIYSRLKLMMEAKQNGTSFDNVITIGKQNLNLSKNEYYKLKNENGISLDTINYKFGERIFGDDIIKKCLGIKELSIIDYSDYENANILCDLNNLIPEELHSKFDVLIDGGSIEHIFNFPVAIKNYMNLIKTGGELFIFTNSNNHCGHGFYQFSPELFYRVFDKENGFQIKEVILMEHPYPGAELSEKQICYKVKDPSDIGRRSTLVNKHPLGIMVHAKKNRQTSIFDQNPMQSDYTKTWENSEKKVEIRKQNKYKKLFKKILPISIINRMKGLRQLYRSSIKRDKIFYSKWR